MNKNGNNDLAVTSGMIVIGAFRQAESGYSAATIWVNQGSEFAVDDPNMFEDGECSLTIGAGKYAVYFVALGMPTWRPLWKDGSTTQQTTHNC